MSTSPKMRLLVIGLGLIGGSLAKAVRTRGLASEVIGVSRSPETLQQALDLGVVDRVEQDIASAVAALEPGDIVAIGVPTLTVQAIFAAIKDSLPPGVTVTDVASVKGSVIDAAKAVFGEVPAALVPGHPIAGSEQSGVGAAREDLFIDHRVILTPTKTTGAEHLQRVTGLWQSVGALVSEMPVVEHDEVLAATSHLPHMLAFSLVDTLAAMEESREIFRYAAGGFRDFTRIAASDPVMWRDIALANKDALLAVFDRLDGNLHQLRQALAKKDSEYLMAMFTRARNARKPLFDVGCSMFDEQSVSLGARERGVEDFSSNIQHPTSNMPLSYQSGPGGRVQGTIRVPGDKSISHRAIMLGSLAEGVTEISGFLEGEDSLATLQAFRDMGVGIEGPQQGSNQERVVRVHGVGMHGLKAPVKPLCLGNSGTSMRLLSGLLSAQAFDVTLTGDSSLSARPMGRVAKPLAQMGAHIETQGGGGQEGTPPLKIKGGQVLRGIDYVLPIASAQVKSALLLAGLYAQGTTRVTEPAPTRDHTERLLAGFGYAVSSRNGQIELQGGGKLKACNIDVPADISSAAFFMVAAAITPNAEITLEHVGVNPTRTGVINILRAMGADIQRVNEHTVGGEPVADIRVRYAPLRGIAIPADQVPLAIDEFPAIFVAAACAQGETLLVGAEELRVKESDRIQAMAEGLITLGVQAEALPDGIRITGGEGFSGGTVESHGDHRIAMAFAVAGLRASEPIIIRDCDNVATSFPGFVELARTLGFKLSEQV